MTQGGVYMGVMGMPLVKMRPELKAMWRALAAYSVVSGTVEGAVNDLLLVGVLDRDSLPGPYMHSRINSYRGEVEGRMLALLHWRPTLAGLVGRSSGLLAAYLTMRAVASPSSDTSKPTG